MAKKGKKQGKKKNTNRNVSSSKINDKKIEKNQIPTQDKADKTVDNVSKPVEKVEKNLEIKDNVADSAVKVSETDKKDSIVTVHEDEKKVKKNIWKFAIFLVPIVLPLILAARFTSLDEKIFKAELDIRSVQIEITGDGTVIDGSDIEKNGYASSVGKVFTKNEEDDNSGVYDISEHWFFYAPKISMKIDYKGTIDSIFVYYPDREKEEFKVQKVSDTKKRIVNCFEKTDEFDFMLNYTTGADVDSERIYIVITDKNNDDYQTYCARIDKYDQLSVCSNPISVEVKSDDEIYKTVSYEKNDYWCNHKDQIVTEMEEILKDRHDIK